MDHKHFSHSHALNFHHMPQGATGQCSGCKTPISGNIYACWQCNHFLHEKCFHAARSIRHHSHPLHPLTLMPYPTHQSPSFYCLSCNEIGSGFSYACAECQFYVHVHCALSPNQNPHAFPVPNYAHIYNPMSPTIPHTYSARPQNPTHNPPMQPNTLPLPSYLAPSQTTLGGGLTTQNTPFRPNHHQSNTQVPNYNPQASLSYANSSAHPTASVSELKPEKASNSIVDEMERDYASRIAFLIRKKTADDILEMWDDKPKKKKKKKYVYT